MITVHHLNNSRSQRVLWLLEELGVPYDIKFYERNPKTMLAPPELKAVHPLGKSPVITDGDVTVAESGAILEYLLGKYGQGRLKPKAESKEYMKYIYWMHYAEGSMMSPLLLRLAFMKVAEAPVPIFLKPVVKKIATTAEETFIGPQINSHLDFVESELNNHNWFAGEEFSAADIQMSFPLEAANTRGGVGSRKKIRNFLERIHSRPAYKKAIEKGGPFNLLG